MISVALTGNIGCGKSTVARLLAEQGAVVLDTDLLVHELLDEGGAGVEPVLRGFPEAALHPARAVDRAALARIVFADPSRRLELERLLHPLVTELSAQRIAEAAARGAELVVTEVPLLFEAVDAGTAPPDSRSRFDVVVAVTSDPSIQLARLMARSTLPAGEAELDARRRMAAQMEQQEKARRADFVVRNDGDLQALRREVAVLHSALLSAVPRPPRHG